MKTTGRGRSLARAGAVLSLLFLLAAALPVPVEELDPPPEEQIVTEVIVVTPSATERTLSDEPASVTVLEREGLMADPALALDDVLHSVPGFSLFRRQSSIAAHPTTQGVSLRGTLVRRGRGSPAPRSSRASGQCRAAS